MLSLAQADLPALLADTSKYIGEIQSFRENNRRSAQFNHLSMVSEGIPALGWVAVAPKPCPFIKETADAATFYLNRVLKEYKDTDKQQADWAKSFGAIFAELHNYVKSVHTTGERGVCSCLWVWGGEYSINLCQRRPTSNCTELHTLPNGSAGLVAAPSFPGYGQRVVR